jgi:cell division protein FtsI/penicillin-binding protein 2
MQLRKWLRTAGIALLVGGVTAGGLTACSSGPKPDGALRAFLTAWHDNKIGSVKLLDRAGKALPGEQAQTDLTAIEGPLATRRPELAVKGKPNVKKDDASAVVDVKWPVADTVTWQYTTTVRLKKQKDKWVPMFSPDTVHPDLASGAKLTLKTAKPERGTVLDGAGQPLVSNRAIVTVGLVPQRIVDINVVIGALTSIFQQAGVTVDLGPIPAKVKAAKPDAYVEVVTMRREQYDPVRNALRDLKGTEMREGVASLAPTRTFARALLGQVGDVTKELMDKNPGKYQVGDKLGVSGLQAKYEDRLRGVAGVTVLNGDKVMFEQAPATGAAVKTTLDVKVQNAADAALVGENRRSAMVVVRVSDGAVVAAANGPDGGQLNLAFNAQVPPGSTFKTVSALALLDNGSVTADTPVGCPKTATAGGFTYKNSNDFELGTVPFRTAFAKSCNTAFVGLAPKLGDDGLANAGKSLGVGIPWDLGIDAYTGKVSQGGSESERAASSFGQGTTQVSPLVMAGAAAAVARGQWKQPSLVLDPAPTGRAADAAALKESSLGPLRTMMREVVTDGTASQLKGLPGAELFGKTGTAEFDNNPANTHSWFMGWKGDYAFAVFVEKGGGSQESAVPIAGKFFLNLGA